ncbi:MAG: response regulator [Planctomycetes bacterium]|nr:response regulator [Planctomycetota bacterium]
MRILVVDDDEIARELLGHTLSQAGYEVVCASNGHEALEMLRAGGCRLLISDWVMPEMNGIELCREIRAGDFHGYVYIILLTSRNHTHDIVEGLSAGADDFIAKPFQPAELCVRIRAGERILTLETRDLAIFALAKLAESRDADTGAHLERMRNYSHVIAQHLCSIPAFHQEMSREYVQMIYLTSPLHDIGKVGIPDSVLLKPGNLTPDEFEIMERHTLIGAETLDAALREHPGAEFLRIGRDIALTHHERFDGSGYPTGLKGRDIPLCGRIVALADVYDALTTKRLYKEAFSHARARSIILEGDGTHFDPEIVQAFVQTEEKFLAIQKRFADDGAAAMAAPQSSSAARRSAVPEAAPVVPTPVSFEPSATHC